MSFVKNSTNVLKKVLLCPTTYFEFESINVITEGWVSKGEQINKEECKREHAEFTQAYRENGVEVVMMEPSEGLYHQVFARDFGVCIDEGFIMGKFREPSRIGETIAYEEKMKELGIPNIARCTTGVFEGGDFFFLDDYTMVQGIIARTDRAGFDNVRSQVNELGYEMIGVECKRENLHLDMCFNIIGEKVAVVCKEALPHSFLKILEKRKFQLIDVPQEDVFKHYCNLQALGGDKVISFNNNKTVNEKIAALGFKVIKVDLVEILKGGGGPHCMSFPLLRE
jgi:N-dimethylarginine dimethylaminohydrolase